jgi:hypothetical protein
MKAIEKSMVVSRMFDQAKGVRQTARACEKVETSERQDLARQEMELERARLLARQERELATLRAKCTQLLTVAKTQAEAEERPFKAQVAALEKTTQELRSSAPVPAVSPLNVVASPRGDDLITPRTVFRFSTFKLVPMNPKLKIQPMSSMEAGPRKSRVIHVRSSH